MVIHYIIAALAIGPVVVMLGIGFLKWPVDLCLARDITFAEDERRITSSKADSYRRRHRGLIRFHQHCARLVTAFMIVSYLSYGYAELASVMGVSICAGFIGTVAILTNYFVGYKRLQDNFDGRVGREWLDSLQKEAG